VRAWTLATGADAYVTWTQPFIALNGDYLCDSFLMPPLVFRQSRAVLVIGVPFPGVKDRCVMLKRAYNSRCARMYAIFGLDITTAAGAVSLHRCLMGTRGTKCR